MTTTEREEKIDELRDAKRVLECTAPGSISARNLQRKIARLNRELASK